MALPESSGAPEFPSNPLALAVKRTVPGVFPATKVQVKVPLAPEASDAMVAGTGPDPSRGVARPSGTMVGVAGTRSLAVAPPRLVTVMVTWNSCPNAADPDGGRVASSSAGSSTVARAGVAGSVSPRTVAPEKLSVALAPPTKPTLPAPVVG